MSAEQQQWQPRQVTIADACQITNYGEKKVRQLIRDGILKINGRGRGLRITMASINAYLERGEEWHDESARAGQKAPARSGKIGKKRDGSGVSRTKEWQSMSLTLIARGRKVS